MAQDWAKWFYNSAAWLKCRADYISKVNGLCERCPKPTEGLILHHKIELTPDNINDPNVALNQDNLEFLCLDCHNAIHLKQNVTQNNLKFNANGDLVQIPPVN